MALQASGQIKMSEINTELGRSSTAEISLDDAESGVYATINTLSASYPSTTQPASMSEWYSYDHGTAPAYSNSHYYVLDSSQGDALVRQATTSPFNLSSTQDLSISMWVRVDGDGTANFLLWDLQNIAGATTGSTANRFFLQYNASLNRLIVRHRTNSVNYDVQYAMHDATNAAVTGTGTNSSTKWSSTNRGNVNADGFVLLTVTYDASQSDATNGLKLYWNTSQITAEAATADGARSTSAVNYICIGNNAHNYTTTAGAFDGAVDEVKIYTDVLTSGEISTIYNSGDPAEADETHNAQLLTEFTFDSNTSDSNGNFPTSTNDDGVRTAY